MINGISFWNLLTSYTTIKIFLASFLLGITSGILGIFVSFKKKSLIGDTLSHTVLPGIALSYIFFREINEWVIWIGVFSSSIVSLFLIEVIKRYSKIKSDTVLSLILTSFFGLGNVLMTYAQKGTEDSSIATLEKFILGQIALISETHVMISGIITFLTIFIITFLWKEFKIFSFDESFGKSIGFSNIIMTFILNTLLIGLITISLKATGIILTSAFLIMPVVIARHISDKLLFNVIIVSIISFLSSFSGIIISLVIENSPTGPIIIVVNTFFVCLTCLLAPKYGILKNFLKQKKYQRQIKKFRQLIHFYHNNEYYDINKIESFLFEQKYLYQKENKIIITPKGIRLVENLINGEI